MWTADPLIKMLRAIRAMVAKFQYERESQKPSLKPIPTMNMATIHQNGMSEHRNAAKGERQKTP